MCNEVTGALFELCEINTLLLPLGVEVKEGGFIKIFKLRIENKYDSIKFKTLKWYAPKGFYTYEGRGKCCGNHK